VTARSIDRVTLVAFALVVLFFGANWIGMRFSNRELPPLWGATLRFVAASLLLLALVRARGIPLPRGPALTGAVVFGTLAFGVNFTLAYPGLVHVPAGMGSVFYATVPLSTLLLANALRLEPFRTRALVGALLAIAGAAVVFRDQLSLDVPALAMAAVLAASLADAGAAISVKSFPRANPLATNAVAMTVGALFLFVGSTITGEPRTIPVRTETWLALGWLVGATIAGFVLLVWLLGHWTASATAYVRVISPLVTVVLAATIAGETITSAFAVGGALVIAGVYIGALSRARPAALPDPLPEA
jgi:drug/metabolite transporter (DMT)-like permease